MNGSDLANLLSFTISDFLIAGFVCFLFTMFLMPWIILGLAQRNLIFTIVNEGTAKVILRFGKFRKVIMNYKDHDLDQDWNVWDINFLRKIVEGEPLTPREEARKSRIEKRWKINNFEEVKLRNKTLPREESAFLIGRVVSFINHINPLRLYLGLFKEVYLIGLPFINKPQTYRFVWTSRESSEPNGAIKVNQKMIDYVLVRDDVYYSQVPEAETQDMVPVDVGVVATLRVINPYKALQNVQSWNESVFNTILPVIREFIGSKKFNELHKKTTDELAVFLDGAQINNLNGRQTEEGSLIDDEIEHRWGVHFVTKQIQIISVKPSAKNAEIAAKKWAGEQEKERIIQESEGEKTRLKNIGEGQADALKALVETANDLGVDPNLALQLETMKQTGANGNLIVVPSDSPGLMLRVPDPKPVQKPHENQGGGND